MARIERPALQVYLGLLAFVLFVGGLGQVGVGAARQLFMVGSVGLAFVAFRRGGLALHAEVCIVLFVLGPFLRRIIDLRVGYDPAGTMLVAPLAALMVVLPELGQLLRRSDRSMPRLVPIILMIACVVYGWALSAFQNNLIEATIVAAKYVLPLLYCMVLVIRADQSEAVLQGAARAFVILGPIIGLYGVAQHLAPQSWDQYWMIQSKFVSIGQPYGGQVRVFSTMNSPVSFAAYATCGLLLFSFAPRGLIPPVLVPVVAILPLCLSILLTSVRTAWISASISLLFCLLFNRTRSRALFLILCLGIGIAIALLFTSFGDVIAARFASVDTNVSQDGSGSERLGDYMHVFSEDPRYIFGTGLVPVDSDTKLAALDGQILMSTVQMGTTIGMLYIVGMVWAGVAALRRVRRDEGRLRLVAAALVVGNLAIIPLTAVGIGEIGFLFWMMVGVLSAPAPGPGPGPAPAPRFARPVPVRTGRLRRTIPGRAG